MALQGVYHRDLKLENILMTTEMEVKITDFGLSKDSTMSGWCARRNHIAALSLADYLAL